jgi:hypothetical protein
MTETGRVARGGAGPIYTLGMAGSMNRRELIDAIFDEIQRVFGFENYPTTMEEYVWLEETYGISLEEHRRYDLVDRDADGIPEEQRDEFTLAFFHNDRAVCRFLEGLLRKYRGGSEVYRYSTM